MIEASVVLCILHLQVNLHALISVYTCSTVSAAQLDYALLSNIISLQQLVSFDICAPWVFVNIPMSIFEWIFQQMGFIAPTAFQWHFLRKQLWHLLLSQRLLVVLLSLLPGKLSIYAERQENGGAGTLWIIPNRQLSLTQPLLTPHPGMEEGIRRAELRTCGLR